MELDCWFWICFGLLCAIGIGAELYREWKERTHGPWSDLDA